MGSSALLPGRAASVRHWLRGLLLCALFSAWHGTVGAWVLAAISDEPVVLVCTPHGLQWIAVPLNGLGTSHLRPQWALGWRGERLGATHDLNRPWAPSTRHTLRLGHRPVDWVEERLEAGRESVASTRQSFAAVRLVLRCNSGPRPGH